MIRKRHYYSLASSFVCQFILLIVFAFALVIESQSYVLAPDGSLNNILLSPTQTNPLASLLSILRQPLQPFVQQQAIDPSIAKTLPGVFVSTLLRGAFDSAADLANLRHSVGSSLKGGAMEVLSASETISNSVANAARRAALLESIVTRKALNALNQPTN